MTEKDGEKKIEDMDSGEFIAHVFYNVLGGLHANEEIDARFGVLEMVEDIKQSREELRTRNTELEAEKERWVNEQVRLCQESAELRTRVAELEQQNSKEQTSLPEGDSPETIEKNPKSWIACKRKAEELQNRLSTLEKEKAEWRADAVKHAQEVLGLRAKLSTLLKASEGMEKALEEAVRDCEVFDVSGALEKNFPSTIHAIRENQKRYALALADFRALKEAK